MVRKLVQHVGLVDCIDEKEFRSKLEVLQSRRNTLELQNRFFHQRVVMDPEFHKWKHHMLWLRCMLKNVRIKAGMGQVPEHFYTNMCESMNSTASGSGESFEESCPQE